MKTLFDRSGTTNHPRSNRTESEHQRRDILLIPPQIDLRERGSRISIARNCTFHQSLRKITRSTRSPLVLVNIG
jgi:hypothetical protein